MARLTMVAAAVLFSSPRPSQAQEAPELLKAVMIISHTSPIEINASDAVQGYIADLPVDLVVESSSQLTPDLYMLEALALGMAERHGAKVVFAADFGHRNRVLLYVSLPRVGTTLLRSIDCTDESIEARFEAVSMVIRGILQAMVKGGEIGVHEPSPLPERKPAPESALPAKAPRPIAKEAKPGPAPPPRPWLGLSTSYVLSLLSSGVIFSHGIRTGVIGIITDRMRVFAAYRFTLPIRRETEKTVALDLFYHPIELGGSFEWQRGIWSIEIGGALVLDPVSWRVTPKMDNVEKDRDTSALRFAVAPFFSLGRLLSNTAILYVAASGDINIFQKKFGYKLNSTKEELLNLWPVYPIVQAGLRFVLR